MPSSYVNDRPESYDLERLKHENTSLRNELQGLHEQVNRERSTHAQLLENFQLCHNEDAKKLREERKITSSLAEENAHLRAEIKHFHERSFSLRSESMQSNRLQDNEHVLLELGAINKRLTGLHRDILKNPALRDSEPADGPASVKGSLALQEQVRTLTSELNQLKTLLNSAGLGALPGPPDSLRKGIRSRGAATNSVDGNSTVTKDDLVHLSGPITEDCLIRVMHQRFTDREYYTCIGPILAIVNPMTYNESEQHMIHEESYNPYVVSLVKDTIKRLLENNNPQVIVLSGESGSGKTFAAQLLTRQLLELTAGGVNSDIAKHVLASFTVLRTLGAARTLSNTNSSRMGHFLEFHFSEGIVTKTKIQCFFLDPSRIVSPPPGELNFHIFYQFLAGLTQEERAKLHLQGYSLHNLHFLRGSQVSEEEEIENRTKFEMWKANLAILGIPFADVLRVLVAVILLGNVQFVESDGLELDIKGNNEIKAIAALLGVSGVSLYRGLTTKTRNLRGQVFRSLCDAASANATRDALAKALYARTVAAIVRRANSFKRSSTAMSHSPHSSTESMNHLGIDSPITTQAENGPNTSTTPLTLSLRGSPPLLQSSHRSVSGMIGVVDMFGFEISERNQLEQICVNLCSETIQHFYNTHIFKSTEEYCKEEGVLFDVDMEYADNAPCIELLTCQRAGILTVLDRESVLPRGTCETFSQKVKSQHLNNECFFDPDAESMSFGIVHYAGRVEYDAENLLHLNRDCVGDDIICVFSRQNCNFGFATHLFSADLKTQQSQSVGPKGVQHRISPTVHAPDAQSVPSNTDNPKRTMSQDFQARLDILLKTLVQAQPQFVRCIRSNAENQSELFDRDVVRHQLRALQILETVQLMQSGFPHRLRFQMFVKRYRFLASKKVRVLEDRYLDQSKAIMEVFSKKLDKKNETNINANWTMGKKYVFYSEIVRQQLEYLRDRKRDKSAIAIQAAVRRWMSVKRWPSLKHSLESKRSNRGLNTPQHRNQSSSVSSLSDSMDGMQIHSTSQHHRDHTPSPQDQTCCLQGLDMETPPPVPKSRPYTIKGNMKMGFPQTRLMKYDYPDNGGEVMCKKGEPVKVVGASPRRGYLVVEHRNKTIHVPFKSMEIKESTESSGITL